MAETSTMHAPRRFSFDTAAIWSLMGALGLGALAFIPSANIPFLYTKVSVLALGVLIALAFFILARLTRGNVIVPPATLIGAVWLVPLAYGLSALFSGAPFSQTLFGAELEQDTLGFILICAGIATLTALVFRRLEHYQTYLKASSAVLGLILLVQLAIVLVAQLSETLVSPVTNLVGSFIDLGMLAGLGVITALLALRSFELRSKTRKFLVAQMAIAFFILALVNSSLIWGLVLLVALGLFIEAIMHRRIAIDDVELEGVMTIGDDHDEFGHSTETRSLGAPLITLVIGLFFLIGSSTIGNALVGAFGTDLIDVRPSWQATFEVGSHTYASAPLFGSGPGTFGEEWLKFRDRALNDTIFWNVDFSSGVGFIPTSFVTTGVVGALAWVVFIGAFLFLGLRALLFRRSSDPLARFIAVSSFTGVLYVLALAIFSVPGPIVLALGFFLAGLFISSLRYGEMRREWGVVFARNPRVGFVIVFVLTLMLLASVVAAYNVVERYLATTAYTTASNALSAGDVQTANAALGRSILFAPTDRAYQLASAIGISEMNRIAGDGTLSASEAQAQFQAALSGSIEAALVATQLRPNNYQNWAMLGSVYQTVVPLKIEGAYENAKAAYERAIALNPSNPTLPYILAQLEIAQGNGTAAEEYLNQAINLKNDYTQAIFLLSQLQVEAGRAREALQAAEAAAYFAPNDPVVLFQVGILRSGTGDAAGAVQALARAVELNPQYANARFFLAVAYSLRGQYDLALAELEAVATLSPENAQAVESDMTLLRAGRNPYPPSRLGALGIPQPGVRDVAPTQTTPAAR
jgi:tetratricopeptide (TPR) repeat protein